MSECEVISKEFLEKALGKTVDSFTIQSQSDTGDNFMSILYTLDVNVITDGNTETLHLLSKCYPNSEGRQEFLNGQNIFWKELQVYKSFLPEMLNFQKEMNLPEILKPDFPPLIAGDAVNFHKEKTGYELKHSETLFRPFDNYIMMTDIRKTWGYKMADRFVSFDFDHMILAVEAQAKLHALSWAYKKKYNISDITSKFPSMYYDYTIEKDRKMFQNMIISNADEAIGALKSTSGENSVLITAMEDFKENGCKVADIVYKYGNETDVDLTKYFRTRNVIEHSEEIPWSGVTHGDSHINNMLFHYNSVSSKPTKVILVDLQLCQDSCPTTDLAYLFYTSTTTEFRKKYLDEVLKSYYESFNCFCKLLKTETLPGFTLAELKQRFHRKKVFGLCIGVALLPFLLKEREKAVELDSLKGMAQEDIFVSVGKGMSKNQCYVQRITKLIHEMHEDGIL